MMMKVARALATAKYVARNVVTDLAGLPLYVVQPAAGSMLTRDMIASPGYFYPGLDLALRPQLEAAGEWQGEGVAIIVDAERLCSEALSDGDAERIITGVVLHELCHWVDRLDRPDPVRSSPDPYAMFAEFCDKLKTPPTVAPAFPPVLLGHGEEFIRLAAHAWYRAAHGGGMILRPIYLRFANDYPGLEMLDSASDYIEALGDEPELCEGIALRRIIASKPPEAFTALWNATLIKLYPPAFDAA
jgi:hypothetical protein